MILQTPELSIRLTRKKMKNLRVSIVPPDGEVVISAPKSMGTDEIRQFVLSKLDWIRAERQNILSHREQTKLQFHSGERHRLFGAEYPLMVVTRQGKASARLAGSHIILQVPPETPYEQKKTVLYRWYRNQVKRTALHYVQHWESVLGVRVKSLSVREMKTRWGSCTPATSSIRLNTELGRRPVELLEYVVLHELLHIIEDSHNSRFYSLLTKHMSRWKAYAAELDREPIPYEFWE